VSRKYDHEASILDYQNGLADKLYRVVVVIFLSLLLEFGTFFRSWYRLHVADNVLVRLKTNDSDCPHLLQFCFNFVFSDPEALLKRFINCRN
jgi:hypothetical protein